jgi:hypothetical protein
MYHVLLAQLLSFYIYFFFIFHCIFTYKLMGSQIFNMKSTSKCELELLPFDHKNKDWKFSTVNYDIKTFHAFREMNGAFYYIMFCVYGRWFFSVILLFTFLNIILYILYKLFVHILPCYHFLLSLNICQFIVIFVSYFYFFTR